MHAVFSAIYRENIPPDTEARLSGFQKDLESLVDVALQKQFNPGDERIFNQLDRAFRLKAHVELLKVLRSRLTSVESRSFLHSTVSRTMDANLVEMEKSYRT